MKPGDAGEALLLCEYCQQPFARGAAAPPGGSSAPALTLCLKCEPLRLRLVVLTCSGCGRPFPRLGKRVRARAKQGCQRAFCPACRHQPIPWEQLAPELAAGLHPSYPWRPPGEGAYVEVTCTGCGRSFRRLKWRVREGERRGYKRQLCPLCSPRFWPVSETVVCSRCGEEFLRRRSAIQKKRRLGYQRAVCPKCWLGRAEGPEEQDGEEE
jgi:hypothetical protein